MATTFPWTTGSQGAWNGWGALAARISTLRTLQSSLKTERATVAGTLTDANMHTAQQAFEAFEELIDQVRDYYGPKIVASADELLIKLVNAEDPVPALTREAALDRLIDFMIEDDYYISGTTVGATPSYDGGNTGTGVLIAGYQNADGASYQQIKPETVRVECIQDSQSGGVIGPVGRVIRPGEELFRLRGEEALSRLDVDWPGGSGMDAIINSTHGGVDQGIGPGQNKLKNSDLEAFTSNVPDYWTVEAGTAGTHFAALGSGMRGSNALKFIGDGSTLPKLSQALNSVLGTKLRPLTPYAISIWARHDGTAAAAGEAVISLQDSGDNIINSASVTIDLTALTSSWVAYTGMIVTPAVIPDGPKFAIEQTTALENTKVVHMDEPVLQEAFQPLPAGLAVAIADGGTNWTIEDLITIAVTNNWSAGTWMMELERVFELSVTGRVPPTSGTTLLNDNLIV